MNALARTMCTLLLIGVACLSTATAAPTSDAPATRQPAERDIAGDLGIVVDFRRVGVDGLTVLAVTPGGPGERLGLRPGDRIVAANGRSLGSSGRPSAVLASALPKQGGQLRLDVVRDGQSLALAGVLDGRSVAAAAPVGCGHVTADGAHPRASRDIFPVVIAGIDGNNMLAHPPGRHRVDAGRRVLVVQELIDEDRFTGFGLDERARQQARHGRRLDKVLIVDVEPGMTYSIGARTSRRISTASIRDHSYWEPVVWRTVAEPCP